MEPESLTGQFMDPLDCAGVQESEQPPWPKCLPRMLQERRERPDVFKYPGPGEDKDAESATTV